MITVNTKEIEKIIPKFPNLVASDFEISIKSMIDLRNKIEDELYTTRKKVLDLEKSLKEITLQLCDLSNLYTIEYKTNTFEEIKPSGQLLVMKDGHILKG